MEEYHNAILPETIIDEIINKFITHDLTIKADEINHGKFKKS